MKFFRLLTALAVIAVSMSSSSWGIGVANATAPSDPYMWSRSGPTSVRFSSVAVSKDGRIAFAVPDPAAPINPPAKGFRSTNGGTTWTQMSSMEDRYWFHVDTSANGQVVFATGSVFVSGAFQSAVFKSVDSGVSWTTVIPFDPSTPGVIHGDVSVSEDGQKVVIGTNTGLVYSANQGASWTSIWSGVTRGVAIAGNGSVIMIQEANTGIHKSTNFGSSWTTVNATPNNWSTIELSTDGQSAVAVANRNGSWGGAFFTHDGGSTWTDAGLNSTFAQNQLAIGAISPDGDTMIASSYYSAPRASFDRGVTWTVLPQEITNQNQWTGFAIADPDPSSLVNTAEPIIIAVTENSRIARFGERPPPTATAIQPNIGRHTGGRTVRIIGTDFVGVTSVTFGGVAAQSFTVDNPQLITAVTPANVAGEVPVTVATVRGSASIEYTYVDTPAPSITSVTPSVVGTAGISEVRIVGSNFENLTDLTVNGDPPVEFGFVSSTMIIVLVPKLSAGPATIVVTTEAGEASAAINYDPSRNPSDRRYTEVTSFNAANLSEQTVFDFGELPGGSVLTVGSFQDAGNVPTADCVATWNGVSWSGLGSDGHGDGAIDCDNSLGYRVAEASVTSDGHIFIRGNFRLRGSVNEYAIAQWDGTTWRGLLEFGQFAGSVTQLEAHSRSRVYIGGSFLDLDAQVDCNHLGMWDGVGWTCPGSAPGAPAFNNPVAGLTLAPSGSLYVIGYFTAAGGVVNADHLAKWDGSSWSAVGDDGAGGPRFDSNQSMTAMTVVDTFGLETVIVSYSTYDSQTTADIVAFVGGRWISINSQTWIASPYDMRALGNGDLVAFGMLGDSTTRGLNNVAFFRDGKWTALAPSTALVPDEFYLSAGRVLSDGRIVVSLLTAVNGVVSTKMLIFDPIEATPMLPATGAETYAWPATGVLLMGIALVLGARCRRFRVR